MALTISQENAIIKIYLVTSIISLIADCFIIFGYLAFRSLKKLAFTFVFCIALGDVCRSLAQTWGDVSDLTALCRIQGWLQTFGAVAMGLFFATIAAVCLSIKKFGGWWKTKTQADIKRFQQLVVLFVAVFAMICAFVPWNTYEYGGGWCWIDDSSLGHILRYVCYYGVLFVCLLLILIIYPELFRIIRAEQRRAQQKENDDSQSNPDSRSRQSSGSSKSLAPSTLDTVKKQRKVFNQMKLYPVALVIGQGPGMIRRLTELFGGSAPFGLICVHAVCSGLFGFITAVIYGTRTWQIYSRKMQKLCERKEEEPPDTAIEIANMNQSE